MKKSVIGFIAFVIVVSGLIFLGVIDKDPNQEEREIAAKAENQLKTALEKRVELIDEIVYRIRQLDRFFGKDEFFAQALEDCEKEKTATKELLEEIRDEDHPIGQERLNFERLEKSNAELRGSLRELKSLEDELLNETGKAGKKGITI